MTTAGVATPDIPMLIVKGSLYHWAFSILDRNGALVSSTAGLTAACQIRAAKGSSVLYHTFSGANININATTKTVELKVPGATSAAWAWQTAYYALEVTDGAGDSHRLAQGPVLADDETTF